MQCFSVSFSHGATYGDRARTFVPAVLRIVRSTRRPLEFNFAGDCSAQQHDKLYKGQEKLNQGIIVTMALWFQFKQCPSRHALFEESIS
jgi:hypothetical protein